jgi:tRNA pseudouridine38-40 synthase
VVCLEAVDAPASFDARFSASAREYRYRIDTSLVADPFTARFMWHHPAALDLTAMRTAARSFVGEHDFTSFCRHPGLGKATVRDLRRLSIARHGDRWELTFRANAFLHQMVRSITGTLVAVGRGRVDPASIPAILERRDRSKLWQPAPARGLTLERVAYGSRARPPRTPPSRVT